MEEDKTDVNEEHRAKYGIYLKRSLGAVSINAIFIFVVGITAYARILDSAAGAFWSAIPMTMGVIFALTGMKIEGPGKPLMVASIIFLSVAVLMNVIACTVDGTSAEYIKSFDFNNCYYSGETEDYLPPCVNATKSHIYNRDLVTYPRHTCACCYAWKNSYVSNKWNAVYGCEEVESLFQSLLWVNVALNVLAMVACVISCTTIAAYVSVMKKGEGELPNAVMFNAPNAAWGPTTPVQQQNFQQPNTQSPLPGTVE